MEGMEKIRAKIAADAQAEADRILLAAQGEADAIAADYAARAKQAQGEAVEKGRAAAAQREERLVSAAAMEGRQAQLRAKQEMVSQAFDLALEKLKALPQQDYVNLLARLAAKAAVTGREEVVLNAADRERVGKAVVAAANELLAKEVAPKMPDELTESKAGAILEKVVSRGTALLAGTAMLTLSEKTAPIQGGLILADGQVEVNCAFETLVRLAKNDMAAQVASVLFE